MTERPTIAVYLTDHTPPQPHLRVDRPGLAAVSAPIEDGAGLIRSIADAFGWTVTIDRADQAPPLVDHPQPADPNGLRAAEQAAGQAAAEQAAGEA